MAKSASKIDWRDRALMIAPVYYGLCLTEEAYFSELKRQGIPEREWDDFILNWHSSATAHHFENRKEGKYMVIVCLGSTKGRTREQVYALLVHEAVHVWQQIKRLLGEDCPGVEQEAYSIQAIAQELMISYREQKKRKGGKK